MSTLITKLFKLLDLDDIHAKAYLCLLQNGTMQASKVSKIIGIPRSSCYDVLRLLNDKGLVSESNESKIKLYSACNPEVLKEKLIETENEVQSISGVLSTNYQQLENMYLSNKIKFPKVHYFSGDGLKTALYDSLSAKEILVVCSGNTSHSNINIDGYLSDFFKQIDLRNISTKEILHKNENNILYSQNILPNKECRFYEDYNSFLPHTDKQIYDGKVAYFSYENNSAFIIEDEFIFETEKWIFYQIWNSLK